MELLILKCPHCRSLCRYYDKNPTQISLNYHNNEYLCTKCRKWITKNKDNIYRIISESKSLERQNDGKNKKMAKIVSSEAISLDDGKYKGEIVNEELRTTMYNGKSLTYNDFEIAVDGIQKKDGSPFVLRTGFSFVMSKKSELGQFYERLTGETIDESEKEYDTAKLVGKKVSFLVSNNKTDKGTFANIVKQSIKLL